MKPLKLTMCGLGPYWNKVEVDFSKFADNGIYLVTGETGSGKTFIFDAICYALYGAVSGGVRDEASLRTVGLSPETPTFVELKFECGGKEYLICRNPAYLRPKKKGEGLVQTSPKVELTDLSTNRLLAEKTGDVEREIHSIIGLNLQQFRQIVMIAQGKFAEIMQNGTKERSDLLRDIFNTGIYKRLDEKIAQDAKALRLQYTNLQTGIKELVQGIRLSIPEAEAELTALQEQDYTDVHSVLELLEKFSAADGAAQNKLEKNLSDLQIRSQKLQVELNKAQTRARQEKDLKDNEQKLRVAKEEYAQALTKMEETAGTEGFFMDKENEKKDVEQKRQKLLDIYRMYIKYSDTRKGLEKRESDFRKATLDAIAAKQKYTHINELFIMAQAGFLAQDLKDGQPCPVCGSRTHSKLAVLPEHTPSKDEVEKSRNADNSAESKRSKLEGNVMILRQQVQEQLKEFQAAAQEHYQQDCSQLSGEDLAAKIIEDGKPLGERLDKLVEEMKNKRRELGMNEGETLIQFCNRLNQNVTAKNQILSVTEGRIKVLQKELADSTAVGNLEDLQQQERTLKNETKTQENQKISLLQRVALNKNIGQNIIQKEKELKELRERLQELENLSKTLSGSLSKDEATKLSFETYMQQAYFDRILFYANSRLKTISFGQYSLVRQKEEETKSRSKVGLELNVHDAHTGKERSVKSLSGGETFMASLSLALGMADEVQASAGGIHIETMFIDEGFGTLSKGFLDTTVDVLNNLAKSQHLVGIISHVEELKERIEQQILVTKNQDGHSSVEVVA